MVLFDEIKYEIIDLGTYPSVLRAAVVVLADDVAVLRTAVLRVDRREHGGGQGKNSDSSELHYEY
jgi:hypothetical protein